MSLIYELKRRHVFRVAAFYIVASWLVLQVTDLAFESWGIPDDAVRYVWIGALLGFPLALFVGWQYDISWQGALRTPSTTEGASEELELRRRDYLVLGAVAVLAMIIIAAVVIRVQQTQAVLEPVVYSMPDWNTIPDKSLAVLPFVNMSDEAANEYFSDGISEELLNRLNRIAELKVSARTSSFSFRNKDIGITEIARRLGVRHVLEGSVRRSDDRIRVSASLIDAQSGYELWSQTFDRQLENVFAVQDEISTAVVDALKVALLRGPTEQVATENLKAYQLYLEGRFELHRRNAESIQRSIHLFDEAISLDPAFARAYLELAIAIHVLPGFVPLDRAESAHDAKSLARRAFALDSSLGKAVALTALISLKDGDWTAARSGFEDALEISNHEPLIHLWYGTLLASMGQTRQALHEIQLAYELDPQSGLVSGWMCATFLVLDDVETAQRHCRNAVSLGFVYANFLQSQIYLTQGDYEQAAAFLNAFSKGFSLDDNWVRRFMAAIQNRPSQTPSNEILDALESQLGRRWDIVGLYVMLGNNDRAYSSAAVAGVGNSTMNHIWMPNMLAFRQDSRFEPLMEEMGIISYWRQYGWPKSCRFVGESLICD